MAVVTFDTLKFANTLKTAGVPAQQAEAQAVAFAEVIQGNFKDLATKEDLALAKNELKQDIAQVRTELKQEIAQVRTELKQDIALVRTELAQVRTELKQDNESLEQRLGSRIDLVGAEVKNLRTELKGELTLLKWMFGVGVTVGLGILVRLFLFRGPI